MTTSRTFIFGWLLSRCHIRGKNFVDLTQTMTSLNVNVNLSFFDLIKKALGVFYFVFRAQSEGPSDKNVAKVKRGVK